MKKMILVAIAALSLGAGLFGIRAMADANNNNPCCLEGASCCPESPCCK